MSHSPEQESSSRSRSAGLKVYPAHAGMQADRGFRNHFLELVNRDRFKLHRILDDPAGADLILLLDLNEHAWDLSLKRVRRHPIVRQYREKTFVYCEFDEPWCVLPGLYVSMPHNSFDARRQRPCSYIFQDINPHVSENTAAAVVPDLLFSFMGRDSHAVRKRILDLRHPRSLIEDTSRHNFFQGTTDTADLQRLLYAQVLYRSKFVLCPRGAGTSSYRLFETMRAGRVPVIVSDQWVAPEGPAWETFSIRVRESQTPTIPSFLESLECQAQTMGVAARRAWETWFAPDVLFHRMVEACAAIQALRRVPESITQRIPDRRRLLLGLRTLRRRLFA